LGYAKFESIPQTAFALATGGAFGMYYFVFVMSICITCIWPFSRLGSPVLGAVIAVLFSCTLGMALGVIPRPTFGWFWGIRAGSLRDTRETFNRSLNAHDGLSCLFFY
jgi:hypothetical protein